MSDNDNPDYAAQILAAFRRTECAVTPLSEENFEFVHPSFPAKTHVYATPFFLQFSTYLFARPKTIAARFRRTRDRFLNEANQKTNLAKLTCDETRRTVSWSILCQCRIATGEVASPFSSAAIDHLVMLWLQDLARVVELDGAYEITAMFERRD